MNGALGYVKYIFYMPNNKPPQLPMFTIIVFYKYFGVPVDENNRNIVPIRPVIRRNQEKNPVKMKWAHTIHKS